MFYPDDIPAYLFLLTFINGSEVTLWYFQFDCLLFLLFIGRPPSSNKFTFYKLSGKKSIQVKTIFNAGKFRI